MGLVSGKQKPPPPGGNPEAASGWYQFDNLERRWTGKEWQEAYRAPDGRIDVARGIGQAVVSGGELGGYTPQALAAQSLRAYPPCRIVAMTSIRGPTVGSPMNVFLIQWD